MLAWQIKDPFNRKFFARVLKTENTCCSALVGQKGREVESEEGGAWRDLSPVCQFSEPPRRCLHCFSCSLIGRLLKPNLPLGRVLRRARVAAPVAKPYPAKQAVRGRSERWGGSTGAKGITHTRRYVDATLLSCSVNRKTRRTPGRFCCCVGIVRIFFFYLQELLLSIPNRGWQSVALCAFL